MQRCIILLFLFAIGCNVNPDTPIATQQPDSAISMAKVSKCTEVVQDVRVQHFKYFGVSYPYWYGVAQLEMESNCRENVTAFDGGQGIAQFMPATTEWVCQLIGEKLNPMSHDDAIRMQAFYMAKLHEQNKSKKLWMTYQAYNGGWSSLLKEQKLSGRNDWQSMRAVCSRKVITLKNGSRLNMCDVNYGYSKKISRAAEKFRMGQDEISFW